MSGAQFCPVLPKSDQLTENLDPLVSIREVADLFGVDISTVRRWEQAGHLHSVRVGERGHRRFRQKEIQRLLRSRDDFNDRMRRTSAS
jgi:excisionase family DNA binding protein